MFRPLLAILIALPAASSAAAPADEPVTARQLMRHVEVLASDAFEGRAPGTEGERRTTDYIVEQLSARGFEPGAADGSWYQPVELIERQAVRHQVRWTGRGGRALDFDDDRVILVGTANDVSLADAPVVFVGHGMVDRARGVDQLAGTSLEGAVALILVEGPDVPGFPSFEERVRAVEAAGAAAVVAIVPDEVPWQAVAQASRQPDTILAGPATLKISGGIPLSEVTRLVRRSGGDFASILNAQSGPSFRAVPLDLRASLTVTSRVRRFRSNNVIGRLRGTGGGSESVLLMGHWDHIGLCRPEGTRDRICNGAVDNASGIASLIEAAGRLGQGARPHRDILVLATTAEESGLLGAHHFARNPTVPLESIAAAINLDTVAINPRGELVAVIGRGMAELDSAIAATAASLGRTMDSSHAADALIQRQDGWALIRAGVPAVMVGGSFANMPALQAFLGGNYHGPDDEVGPSLQLEGAAEDTDLLVALARRLADPAHYRRPAGWRAPAAASM